MDTEDYRIFHTPITFLSAFLLVSSSSFPFLYFSFSLLVFLHNSSTLFSHLLLSLFISCSIFSMQPQAAISAVAMVTRMSGVLRTSDSCGSMTSSSTASNGSGLVVGQASSGSDGAEASMSTGTTPSSPPATSQEVL